VAAIVARYEAQWQAGICCMGAGGAVGSRRALPFSPSFQGEAGRGGMKQGCGWGRLPCPAVSTRVRR